jgi:rubrerythrin
MSALRIEYGYESREINKMSTSIYEIAMEKERQMHELYLQLAAQCKNTRLHGILMMLAEQEGKHFKQLENLSEIHADQDHSDIIHDVKDVFLTIKKLKDSFSVSVSQLKLYKDVRDFEKQNEDFYRAKASEVADPKIKATLNSFADEEHKHFLLMSEMVDFVERPEQWVEHAEFNHIEEY